MLSKLGPSYKEVYGMDQPTMPELKKLVTIENAIRLRLRKVNLRMSDSEIGAMARVIFLALRDAEG